MSAEGTRTRRTWLWALAGVTATLLLVAAYAWRTWPDVGALARRNPPTTAFIEQYKAERRAAGRSDAVAWKPVPYDRISPDLKRAVVAAEDLEFFFHHGFSSYEMKQALGEAIRKLELPRGASTITQQLAKNIWLSATKSPLRKLREVILTWQLERNLTKRRILGLYLNVVEFGPGIYGAEAAARHYFGKSASALTEHEAAQLAAGLPRPATWHPGRATRGYTRYVAEIERRMSRAPFLWRMVGATPAMAQVDVNVDSILGMLWDTLSIPPLPASSDSVPLIPSLPADTDTVPRFPVLPVDTDTIRLISPLRADTDTTLVRRGR